MTHSALARVPIIDCHVHLNNYHEQLAVSLEQSLDKLQAAMVEAEVAYSLVLTSYLVSEHRPSTAQVVRAVEIAAGLIVLVRPRIGAYVVAAWLAGIILDLLLVGGYGDVALRDFGLLLAALTLGRLATAEERGQLPS